MSDPMPGPVTRDLARWVCDASRGRAHPESVRRIAWASILDTAAVAVAGAARDVTVRARVLARGSGTARFLGRQPRPVAPADAAFVNAVAAHALDYDDTCFAGIVHASAAIAPAVLAVGEALDAGTGDVLDAFVSGSEVAYALGAAVGPSLYDAGWFPTGCLVGPGVAAGVARLVGLDEEGTAAAIGLAAARSTGLRAILGSDAKPIAMGMVARAGVEAVELAGAGVRCTESIIEGRNGLFELIARGRADERVARAPGVPYRLADPGIVLKAYPMCSSAQAAIEGVAGLVKRHAIDPAGIASIRCHVAPMVARSLPFDRPRTSTEAMFSLPYAVSRAALSGAVEPAHLEAPALTEPAVLALMSRVRHEVESALDSDGTTPEAARVLVEAGAQGTFEARVPIAAGDPRVPMSESGFDRKQIACLAALGPAADPPARAGALAAFPMSRPVRELVDLLCGESPPTRPG